VDKHGEEWYQVTVGGAQGNEAAIGTVLGPSVAAAEVPEVVARLIETYLDHRHEDERFIDTVRRVGVTPFQRRAYAAPQTERKVANG